MGRYVFFFLVKSFVVFILQTNTSIDENDISKKAKQIFRYLIFLKICVRHLKDISKKDQKIFRYLIFLKICVRHFFIDFIE